MIKKFTAVIIAFLLISLVASGCEKQGEIKGKTEKKIVRSTLTITYDDSIYGSAWIKQIADKYKKEHKNTDINLISNSKLNQEAGKLIESDSGKTDIIFMQNTNWRYWVQKGYLYDLSGLFSSKIDGGKTLGEKIKSDYLKYCSCGGKYYIVPWDDGVTGILYNKTMFYENGWSVPETMSEFNNLLTEMKEKGIIPIALSGNDDGVWEYAVRAWWSQYEGPANMSEYLSLQNPGVYLQNGRANALAVLAGVISDSGEKQSDILNTDYEKAEKLFFGSKAAMLIGGSWIQTKSSSIIPKNFDMGIMRFPEGVGAKESDINVSAGGGFALIPKNAADKKEAVDFLKFMSTDKMLRLYAEITSSPRPFNFKFSEDADLTEFGYDVMNIWESNKNLYMLSQNPVYSSLGDWPEENSPFLQILLNQKTPSEIVHENYEFVEREWEKVSPGH